MDSQAPNVPGVGWWTADSALRLKEAVKRWGAQTELSAVTGLSRQAIGDILNGNSEPKRENLFKICEAVGADARYVLGIHETFPLGGDLTEVNVLKFEVSGGNGLVPMGDGASDVSFAFPSRWLRSEFGAAEPLKIARARGDSMEPTIRDGGIVMIDTSATVWSDAVYAFDWHDHFYVKRVQLEGSRLRLLSDNRAYDPITVDLTNDADRDALTIIGKVVWAGGKL